MLNKIIIAAISLLMLNSTTAQTPKTAIQYYNDGVKFQDDKKYSEALAQYKKAVDLNPVYKEALYNAGWCCNELKNYNGAIDYLQKANKAWSGQSKIFFELGYASASLKNIDDAINYYNKCIALNEGYSTAYKNLGDIYYNDYDYEKALENYISYEQKADKITNQDFYYRKGLSENELGKYKDAIQTLKRGISLNDKNDAYFIELGYAYKKEGNTDEAIASYKKAAVLNPKSSSAYAGLGDLYKDSKNDQNEAIKNYLIAVSLNSNDKISYYYIGWCYNDLGKYNDAVPYLKKAIQLDEKYVNAITELGYSDYALQNYDDALADFKKSMAIKKTELNLYYSGLCYIGKKQKAEAQNMLKELKGMNSDYAEKIQDLIDKM